MAAMYVSMASVTSKKTIFWTLPRGRGCLRGRKRREELLAQELPVLPVRRQVPLGREADALVRRADAQPVLDVGDVAPTLEEAQEVLALGALHAPDRRLVGEELLRLLVPQQADRRTRSTISAVCFSAKRAERLQARQVLARQLAESAPRPQLGLVEFQGGHVASMTHAGLRGRIREGRYYLCLPPTRRPMSVDATGRDPQPDPGGLVSSVRCMVIPYSCSLYWILRTLIPSICAALVV